ncbi:MAG TPA: hypothetical protein VK689_08785 [Armatimonadota bacterium]|nr:hypothetical protein [Armatimonadota bacterium]
MALALIVMLLFAAALFAPIPPEGATRLVMGLRLMAWKTETEDSTVPDGLTFHREPPPPSEFWYLIILIGNRVYGVANL